MKQTLLARESHQKSALKVYLYYRLIVGGLLIAMFYSGITHQVLGTAKPDLFLYSSLVYFASSFISLAVFPAASLENSTKRISLLLLIDFCYQMILVHSSGGISSGLGYLIVITTAMTSIFIRGQLAYSFAAFISILLLIDTYYFTQEDRIKETFSAGVLGILIFATTAVLQFLTEKIRQSSVDAKEQSIHLKYLQEIAQNIVARMQTGVIVVDSDNQLELINDSAVNMLDLSLYDNYFGRNLTELPQLDVLSTLFDSNKVENKASIIRSQSGTEIRASVANLGSGDDPKSIYYLEDYSSVTQHAQQMKLASLGRLAASIAHEIRNPLGAVSHAAQLLIESDKIDAADKRMTEIILGNCDRVNDIVENTLALSRRKEPTFEKIHLNAFFTEYIESTYKALTEAIHIKIDNEPIFIRFDLTHLRQILGNLIENGLHHSKELNGQSWVEIEVGLLDNKERPYIIVRDNGAGVPADKINHIFDPFFTTEEKGSGLGLYISRELAEINHARLSYSRLEQLSCFRLDFQHYQRIR